MVKADVTSLGHESSYSHQCPGGPDWRAQASLSGLMTSIVKNMAKTIEKLQKIDKECKIMVGGAVLNEKYAKMINADFYGKDAREAVNIAKKFFLKE